MLISFVIPTRNRPDELDYTLRQLEKFSQDDLGGQSEVVIVDNGSDGPVSFCDQLKNGIKISQIHLDQNIGAGARNIGVEHASGDWVIMLDDDSSPCLGGFGAYLAGVEPMYGAIGGEIYLPNGRHEAGGLPEVVVGCGCAIRRDPFLSVGGYDSSFGYYAEEYDLCAKLIASGYAIKQTRAMCFEHRKSPLGRDMNEILYRLVRNNGWVIQRYAPQHIRPQALDEMFNRYEQIARIERALDGYRRGRTALEHSIEDQPRRALSQLEWDRFVGAAALEQSLSVELKAQLPPSIALVGGPLGKGVEQIRKTIESCGFSIDDEAHADHLQVISTLSPGAMLDAKQAFPNAICPWEIEHVPPLSTATPAYTSQI